MALNIEWGRRIENWRKELPNHFYTELGAVELAGLVTLEQLTLEQARERQGAPLPEGTAWGAKWEYAWFWGQVVLPAAAAGKRIALKLDVGAESLVFINGVAAGAVDRQHSEVTLTTEGVPGARYEIHLEGYAGHGPRVHSPGPVPPGRQSVPEPPAAQAVVGHSSFGIWEEEAYQLWLDVDMLWGVRQNIDPDSLRLMEIDRGLREFTNIVDFELPPAERRATFTAARARLKPLLECVNGSTAPTLYAIGHSHIDVAWLWPLVETERKCGRTSATQLALMEEYPEYQFLQSQCHLYWMTQQRYPEVYARILDAIKRGQWIPEGGMWVEADTNVTSGESLIRQFLYGKRFFRDELGVECEMLWLPDVFGYSGALPQIMRGCGIKYFSTAKIFWNYNGGDPFPYNTFMWEGIDGSDVLVHLTNNYNSHTDAASIIERWNKRIQKDGFSTRLVPFGYGDGGGGPTRTHLEYLRRMRDLEGVPRTRIASPIDYFKDQERRGLPEERYVGELYFQAHRGTYTTQARTKRGNRKSELALREAELWSAVAGALKGYAYPQAQLEEAWRAVLLNQFHDIIPGSSIHRVYEEAEAAYEAVIDTAEETAGEAAAALTDDSRAITVFNSLSWPRQALVALPEDFAGAVTLQGESLPVQQMDGEAWVQVQAPACGWTALRAADLCEMAHALPGAVQATPQTLENEHLKVVFDEQGAIRSIWDKESGRELAAGRCNEFKMYKDVTTGWDAWDVDTSYEFNPVALDAPARIQAVASGPLVGALRVTRTLNQSTMTQTISLERGSRRIEFETEIDWQESHKLLKVAFPVAIHANEAVHEIQFGHIRRPNHRSRPFDADRFEVCNHKWTALMESTRGCAVLNDCKYGVNVLGNSINLTLLRSPLAPDMTADKGLQRFAYAFYAWNGCFAESDLVREGYELNCPVMTVSGSAGEASMFSIDAPNVIIETIKLAEDGSSDVIVRLYESKCAATHCRLFTSLPCTKAQQTNMLEAVERPLAMRQGAVALDLRPFEIKTVRLGR
jgi:alpha-mannosidase